MMSDIMHDCDTRDHNLNLSHRSSLYENNTIENDTTSTHGTEDETFQTKHEIFLLKQLLKMQNDMMCEYEKSIENLSRNSPRSSAGSIDSECYLELEKKIEELRDENKRLVLECRRSIPSNNDIENEKILISRDVYDDLVVERKHLKSQYDVYKELFESSEAHVFNLEDTLENMKVENKQLLSEINKCNLLIDKLKEDNNTCRMEFDDLIKQLNKKNEDEVNYYEMKIGKLIHEKKQLLDDIESLTTTIEIIKGQKCDISSSKECIKDSNYVEILNNMSKLIDELEEKLSFYANFYQQLEISHPFDREIIIYNENDKISLDNNIIKYQQIQPPSIPNVKSLGEEIEEIQYKEICSYNMLSSSQQSTIVESFIYLAICLLVYEFYLFILYIFKQ